MTVYQIEVDQNKKCSRCGKGGVASSEGKTRGLCLSCINKELKEDLKKHLTTEVLQEIAGDIEKLLIEKQEQLEWAFKRVPDGFKVSIGITLDHTIPPTAEYSVSFPLEPAREPVQKETVKLRKVVGQGELEI